MKKVSILLLQLCFVFSFLKSYSQSGSQVKCDSINRDSLYKLAGELQYAMEHKQMFSDKKAVVLIKVYNTFHIVSTITKPITRNFASNFISLFRNKYLTLIGKQIGYSFGKGMSLYCPKYDIYVAPLMTCRCKDYYSTH